MVRQSVNQHAVTVEGATTVCEEEFTEMRVPRSNLRVNANLKDMIRTVLAATKRLVVITNAAQRVPWFLVVQFSTVDILVSARYSSARQICAITRFGRRC